MRQGGPLKVGWILVGPRSVPSARIEGYNLHDWLNAHGQESSIIKAPVEFNQSMSVIPPLMQSYDVIIFQKVFAGLADQAMQWYRQMGIAVIFYITDLVQGIDGAIFFSSRTIMSTTFMVNCLQPKHKERVVILKDAYETPKDFYKTDYKTDKIKVTWFGTDRIFEWVEEFRASIWGLGYEFTTICSDKRATKQWNEKEIANDIKNSDIVFLPSPLDGFAKAKDENRLVQAMVIGVPCIAYPVPAYMELYNKHKPEPFFIASTPEEVVSKMKLLGSEEVRKEIGQWGRECVKDDYHIDNIGHKFLEILRKEAADAKGRKSQFTLNK